MYSFYTHREDKYRQVPQITGATTETPTVGNLVVDIALVLSCYGSVSFCSNVWFDIQMNIVEHFGVSHDDSFIDWHDQNR